GPDQVTVAASLVVLDFLLRQQALPGDPAQLAALRALARPLPSPLTLPSPRARGEGAPGSVVVDRAAEPSPRARGEDAA
ncbi:MAG: hypothetical protein WCB48_05395, partial [Casimicrobiaceae bacterium]